MQLITSLQRAWTALRSVDESAAFVRSHETLEAAAVRRTEALLAAGTRGLPDFGPGGALPAGVHQATVGELVSRLGFNEPRLVLLEKLASAMSTLRTAGVQKLVIGGSAATSKAVPNDLDIAYLGGAERDVAKALRYLERGGSPVHPERADGIVGIAELLPGHRRGESYLEFFAGSRNGGQQGVIALDLQPGSGVELRRAVEAARAGLTGGARVAS